MCQVSCPVKSAQLNGKANLGITPKTDSIIGWLRPLGVWFKGPVHPILNERISLTQRTKRFYFSLNVPEIIFQKVSRRQDGKHKDVKERVSTSQKTRHPPRKHSICSMITDTAVLLPQCICSPSVLWATAEPLWRRNQRRQPEQDPSVHDYHYLFSSGGKESGVDVAVCAHASVTLYFFPLLLLHPQCPHDSSASSTTSTESSDKWNYQPFDIQLSSSGKIIFRRWRRRRRGLRIQDSRLCFQPFGDGSFVLRAPDWSNLKQR